jgi:hypothetical protein
MESKMKSGTRLMILALCSAPGIAVLLGGLLEGALEAGPGALIGQREWARIGGYLAVVGLFSPLTTCLTALVALASFRQLGSRSRWVAGVLCAASVLGTLYFWGAISMVGYRGY